MAENHERMLMRLPFCLDWVNYKGDDVVAQWNLEATIKANKPMVDISYCMTKALNQVILETVQWDKSKFKPSKLGCKWVKTRVNKPSDRVRLRKIPACT